ncbi:hypothetical protein PUR71_08550 [Streptomyces sp. SP17BM10]|uniref:hypothetical protein n=1 Tax=Streptomyces sp. SP17BM10 TaxID=3002530 RepID=UPI002E774AA3|nr:hypothetical protein [Streptomyces sp. SP17BM10]MEE1782964.1 hypothetical protein [Streptomyces sp. SP17BM10]
MAYWPPSPQESWLMGGVMAVVQSGITHQLGYWVDARELSHDDGSSNHWQLRWVDGGRAVLTGFDVDYSTERALDELLQGAPDWLPLGWYGLTDRIAFCFWWERGAADWDCAPVEDDGVRITGSVHGAEDLLTDRVMERIPEPEDEDDEEVDEGEYLEEFGRKLAELVEAAREHRLTERELAPVLGFLEDPGRLKLAAALDTAREAGFTPGGSHPWERPAARA